MRVHHSIEILMRSDIKGEFECEWGIKCDDMTVVEIFESKQSALINGRTGTGKTTLVNQLIELIKQPPLPRSTEDSVAFLLRSVALWS
jgi:Cdc6-like AAA superfamily ATPase